MASKFLPWIDDDQLDQANLISTTNWANDTQRSEGFKPNTAASAARVNTALRGTTAFVAAFMNFLDPAGTYNYDTSVDILQYQCIRKLNANLKNLVDVTNSNGVRQTGVKSAESPDVYGQNTFAFGTSLVDDSNQTKPKYLLGQYNSMYPENDSSEEWAFVIGRGTPTVRYNLFGISYNGDIYTSNSKFTSSQLDLLNTFPDSAPGNGIYTLMYDDSTPQGIKTAGIYCLHVYRHISGIQSLVGDVLVSIARIEDGQGGRFLQFKAFVYFGGHTCEISFSDTTNGYMQIKQLGAGATGADIPLSNTNIVAYRLCRTNFGGNM